MLCTRDVVVDEFKSEDKPKVSQEDENSAKRGDFDPKGPSHRSPLGIGRFAEDSCDCSN